MQSITKNWKLNQSKSFLVLYQLIVWYVHYYKVLKSPISRRSVADKLILKAITASAATVNKSDMALTA